MAGIAELIATHGRKFILIHVVTISARGSGVVGVEDEEEDDSRLRISMSALSLELG